eukprot:3504112-Rhodomonas_salina.1
MRQQQRTGRSEPRTPQLCSTARRRSPSGCVAQALRHLVPMRLDLPAAIGLMAADNGRIDATIASV